MSFASDLSPTPASKPALIARSRGLSADLDSGVSANVFNPLDSFFPFDPCLLKMAHSMIAGDYRSWDGVPGLPRTWNPQLADVSQSSAAEGSDDTGLENAEDLGMDCEESDSDDDDDDEEEDDEELDVSLHELSARRIESFVEEKADDVDPFMRRYKHGSALDKDLLVKVDILNGNSEEDAREVSSMYGFGAKRCSPVATPPSEGHRRRRYSITSSMDW